MSCTTCFSLLLGRTIQLIVAAVLVRVSINALERRHFSFYKEQSGRKAKILLFRRLGERNLLFGALYILRICS